MNDRKTIKFATPEVTIIGQTEGRLYNIEHLGMDIDPFSDSGEDLMEFAGRGCYQSFHKPNPATRDNADYLRNIIDQGHESVLEHSTVTFYITGVSRAFTHELVRHRMFNFSQLSQRFVNEESARLVLPPAIERDSAEAGMVLKVMEHALEVYGELVDQLQNEQGLPRKQAREAARAVLINATETRITVTGNHRAWRQFLWRRLDPAADREIREVAGLILDHLYALFPALYEDIAEAFNESR